MSYYTDTSTQAGVSTTWVKVARVASPSPHHFHLRPISTQELNTPYIRTTLGVKSIHTALKPALKKKDTRRYLREMYVKQRSEGRFTSVTGDTRAGNRSCTIIATERPEVRFPYSNSTQKPHFRRVNQTKLPSVSSVLRTGFSWKNTGKERYKRPRKEKNSEIRGRG